MNKVQSLKKRYAAKLSTNLIGLLIGLATATIIPRGLGPKGYGDFSFLNNFFIQLIPFFTFSTSFGFYTKLSSRNNEFGLVSFYGRITAIAISLLFVFFLISKAVGTTNLFWPDQSINFILMAILFVSISSIATILQQISDARGITVSTEIAKIIIRVFGLILILALFSTNKLSLTNFYYYHYFILLILNSVFIYLLYKSGFSLFQNWRLSRSQLKSYFREFYSYSQPLFLYGFVGVFIALFDRWILQKYGGSIQQGYFGLSVRVGALCFLFTGAMTSLITREFSIAHIKNNIIEMKRLFRRYVPMLYSIVTFIGCFIAVQSENVTYFLGGNQFSSAALPMTILAFYPIHQTYGQLNGSVFYASGRTKLYSKIGMTFRVLGLPIAFFALAPSEYLGLNAGATGLAVKIVLVQFIGVNVQLFYNAKLLKLNFIKYFAHQLIIISLLISISFLSKLLIDSFSVFSASRIINFLSSGVLYSSIVVILVLIFPLIFGLYRRDINNIMSLIRKIFIK